MPLQINPDPVGHPLAGPLTVPARSVIVTPELNPALLAAALLITVMLLSMAYEIANPPRTEVLPSFNGSQAKLKFGAKLFRSLAIIGRFEFGPPAESNTTFGSLSALKEVFVGSNTRPSRSVTPPMYSQRRPRLMD